MEGEITSDELRSAWLEGPDPDPIAAWGKLLVNRFGMDEGKARKLVGGLDEWVRISNASDERGATKQWDGQASSVPEGYRVDVDSRNGRRFLKLEAGRERSIYNPEDVVRAVNTKLMRAGVLPMPIISLEEIAVERFGVIETGMDDALSKFAQSIADALNDEDKDGYESAMMRSPLMKEPKKILVIDPNRNFRGLVGMTVDPEVDGDIESCVSLMGEYVARHRESLEQVCNQLHLMIGFRDEFLVSNADPELAKLYTEIAERLFKGHAIEVYEYVLPNFREKSLMKLLQMSGVFCMQAAIGREEN